MPVDAQLIAFAKRAVKHEDVSLFVLMIADD